MEYGKDMINKTINTLKLGTELMLQCDDYNIRAEFFNKQVKLLDIIRVFIGILRINDEDASEKIKKTMYKIIDTLELGYFGIEIEDNLSSRLIYETDQKRLINIIEEIIKYVEFED